MGPVILETILALPSVKAVVWAGIPGQESGNGLVDILYGSTSPSGKLPYTIAKQASDYGTAIVTGDDSFTEGLFIDYRHFDHAAIAPRYEFGFGLCKSPNFILLASTQDLLTDHSLHHIRLLWPSSLVPRLCGEQFRYNRHRERNNHQQRHRCRG